MSDSGGLQKSIVCVTGASSGIGRATARACAHQGSRLLLVARRQEPLQEIESELKDADVPVLAVRLDVRDAQAVARAFEALPQEWRAIDVLVNNAGLSRGLAPVQAGEVDDWDEMIDTNVKGLLYVTRAVVPGMIERGAGHVINIGSIAGREVYANGAVYCASKWAVRALTQGLRVDLHDTPVRVTTIDPGLVQTNFSTVRFHGDTQRAAKVYEGTRPLRAEDVAEAVVWSALRPPHVNVAEMVLLAADQATATTVRRDTAPRDGS
jgi:NADP-dependent 3-hydroxy acid dehydrogenase YdfG